MPAHFDGKNKIFYLETKNSSYVFSINKYGFLQNLHYGRIIDRDNISYMHRACDRGFSPSFPGAQKRAETLDNLPSEFPVSGNGDFRHSAILTKDAQGNRLEDLRYVSHEILSEKPPLKGMPSLSGGETLKITLGSKNTRVTLFYTVYYEQDSLTRRAAVENISSSDLTVERLMSCSVDFPSSDFDVISLHGRHCSERNYERSPLRHGLTSIYSNRGASSHQHNPFLCLAEKNADEKNGLVYGFNYVYGGNFIMSCEVDQFDTLRVQSGFNPFDFSYLLNPGEVLESPETVIVFSDGGLGQMSRNFHDLYRGHLINKNFVKATRPIVINSWEAVYFSFDTEKLSALIDSCKGRGFDTFVLDDGWFGVRNSDTSGLGDWYVNTDKLKGGLNPVIERCKMNGLKFGLWFEPEMVSPDSDLYRAHPDWCIHVEGVEPSKGRDQLILDLSRTDVRDYLKAAVGGILKDHEISYVKWDMNRHMTDVCSSKLPTSRQQELRHRYMLGFYDLADYLTKTFPSVLFEGCSGGGGRFDPSMLYYFPQYWTSDCSDAFERGRIQYGTSLCYPLSASSNHVSVCPNHQTGRNTPLSTRGNIASLGCFGYELNPPVLNAEELETVKKQTTAYKKLSPLVLEGDLYRLANPFTGNAFCFLIVSKDKKSAHLTYMNGNISPNAPLKQLRLEGLDETKTYFLEELNVTATGKTLMNCGILLPEFWGDFASFTCTISEMIK